MARQTITGLLLAASALLQGCASAPGAAESTEGAAGGAKAPSSESTASVEDGREALPVVVGEPDAAALVEGPAPVARPDAMAAGSLDAEDLAGGGPAAESPAVADQAADRLAGEGGLAVEGGAIESGTFEGDAASPEGVATGTPGQADDPPGAAGGVIPWVSLTSSTGIGLEALDSAALDSEAVDSAAVDSEALDLTGASSEAESGGVAPRAVTTADGRSMEFKVTGQGRPVVLIHGWCGNGAQWAETAAALAGSYRVYTVDLVGHGASAGQDRSSWTIAAFGDDVARLLEGEGLRDAVLIGHSMGGPVALEAAVRAPGRVAAIVGVESLHRLAGEADPERMAPYVTRFKEDFPAAMGEFTAALVRAETSPAARARIVADSVACDAPMAIALVEHFGTYDPKPATRIIDGPVRCINADVTPTDVEGNRALLSSFDVELLEATGHWPHLETPERFQAALARVLTEVAPALELGSEAQLLSLGSIVRCEDVAATLEFYTERLRFEEVECEPGVQPQPSEAVTLSRDGTTVVLQSLAGLREDLPEVTLRPGPAILRLEVTNLNAELSTLGDALRIVVPERRLRSGARQVVIEDPAGSLVILRQARERL